MSFRLSDLVPPKRMDTIQESFDAFHASMKQRESDSFSSATLLEDDEKLLNNSRRAHMNLNKFSSMRTLDASNNGSVVSFGSENSLVGDGSSIKRRFSFSGAIDELDASNSRSLMDELTPVPSVPLEVTHGHQINGRKIFAREHRRTQMFDFETPTFQEDLQELMTGSSWESPRRSWMSEQKSKDSKDSVAAAEKRVRFLDVTIREYPIIVGVNPSCSGGPPVAIAWKHVNTVDFDFEKYEKARESHRRIQQHMRLSAGHRRALLRSQGYTTAEINVGTKAANVVRNRRRRVNAQPHRDSSNEILEKTVRTFLNIMTFGAKKRKDKEYLRRTVPDYENRKSKRERRCGPCGSRRSGQHQRPSSTASSAQEKTRNYSYTGWIKPKPSRAKRTMSLNDSPITKTSSESGSLASCQTAKAAESRSKVTSSGLREEKPAIFVQKKKVEDDSEGSETIIESEPSRNDKERTGDDENRPEVSSENAPPSDADASTVAIGIAKDPPASLLRSQAADSKEDAEDLSVKEEKSADDHHPTAVIVVSEPDDRNSQQNTTSDSKEKQSVQQANEVTIDGQGPLLSALPCTIDGNGVFDDGSCKLSIDECTNDKLKTVVRTLFKNLQTAAAELVLERSRRQLREKNIATLAKELARTESILAEQNRQIEELNNTLTTGISSVKESCVVE